jgi:hypothetical protein
MRHDPKPFVAGRPRSRRHSILHRFRGERLDFGTIIWYPTF